jgi:acyl-CoA thioesterase-1
MDRVAWFRRAALGCAVAVTAFVASQPTGAQLAAPGSPAVVVAPAGRTAAPATPATPATPNCVVPPDYARFDRPLPQTQRRLQAGKPIKIVAIGSSSTAGAGASKPYNAYPSRLAAELAREFVDHEFKVVNRGVNGDTAADMLSRFEQGVIAEKPDLVLWQVGTNDALMRVPVEEFATTVRDTVRWLKERDMDVVLVGLQYTLRANVDEYYAAMRKALRTIAAEENVPLVRRFEAMQFIEKAKQSEDGPSLDQSYRCMAEHIAHAIVVSTFMRANPLMRRRQ